MVRMLIFAVCLSGVLTLAAAATTKGTTLATQVRTRVPAGGNGVTDPPKSAKARKNVVAGIRQRLQCFKCNSTMPNCDERTYCRSACYQNITVVEGQAPLVEKGCWEGRHCRPYRKNITDTTSETIKCCGKSFCNGIHSARQTDTDWLQGLTDTLQDVDWSGWSADTLQDVDWSSWGADTLQDVDWAAWSDVDWSAWGVTPGNSAAWADWNTWLPGQSWGNWGASTWNDWTSWANSWSSWNNWNTGSSWSNWNNWNAWTDWNNWNAWTDGNNGGQWNNWNNWNEWTDWNNWGGWSGADSWTPWNTDYDGEPGNQCYVCNGGNIPNSFTGGQSLTSCPAENFLKTVEGTPYMEGCTGQCYTTITKATIGSTEVESVMRGCNPGCEDMDDSYDAYGMTASLKTTCCSGHGCNRGCHITSSSIVTLCPVLPLLLLIL